jgi:hypothetical protein
LPLLLAVYVRMAHEFLTWECISIWKILDYRRHKIRFDILFLLIPSLPTLFDSWLWWLLQATDFPAPVVVVVVDPLSKPPTLRPTWSNLGKETSVLLKIILTKKQNEFGVSNLQAPCGWPPPPGQLERLLSFCSWLRSTLDCRQSSLTCCGPEGSRDRLLKRDMIRIWTWEES